MDVDNRALKSLFSSENGVGLVLYRSSHVLRLNCGKQSELCPPCFIRNFIGVMLSYKLSSQRKAFPRCNRIPVVFWTISKLSVKISINSLELLSNGKNQNPNDNLKESTLIIGTWTEFDNCDWTFFGWMWEWVRLSRERWPLLYFILYL